VRSDLITIFGRSFDCINHHFRDRVTEKVPSGFSMEYVEAYVLRVGFFHPHDGDVTQGPLGKIKSKAAHYVTRSRGWNIIVRAL
jgi:hypothetical protein